MVHALAKWTGAKTQLLNLEGHGREEVVEGACLSRTVGWFTTDYPALLTEAAEFEPGEAIRSTKEALRAIPGNGLGFGAVRYLSQDALNQQVRRRSTSGFIPMLVRKRGGLRVCVRTSHAVVYVVPSAAS